MKKKIIKVVALVLALVLCFAIGAVAANNLEKIQAYLNYGITVKLDGTEQRMYDAKGKRVYPISYEGTTYVPIRAVSNMLGIDVNWDGKNNTVLLGKTGEWMDFIETVQPYSKDGSSYTRYYRLTDNESINIAGKTYNNYIVIRNTGDAFFYNLEGKYEELEFKAFGGYENIVVKVWGDNDELLESIDVKANNLPTTVTVDVRGVQQLTIQLIVPGQGYGADYLHIVDAKIK